MENLFIIIPVIFVIAVPFILFFAPKLAKRKIDGDLTKLKRKFLRVLIYLYILFLLSILVSDFFTHRNISKTIEFSKEFFLNKSFISQFILIACCFAYYYFRKEKIVPEEKENEQN